MMLLLKGASVPALAIPLPVGEQQIAPEAQECEGIFLQILWIRRPKGVRCGHARHHSHLVRVYERPRAREGDMLGAHAVEDPDPWDDEDVVGPRMAQLPKWQCGFVNIIRRVTSFGVLCT